MARAVHFSGNRADKPFVVVSCAALTETLLESELFGYEKGAFTGANAQVKGKFELADGGTIFLDEIGDISPKLQADLLRVLQERRFYRVGGTQEVEVDVRVIAATNKDLAEEVQQGRFREDLYYRLNVIEIRLPPLRERREDIPLLAEHFVQHISSALGRDVSGISAAALKVLIAYDWPGNVRELENVIERAIVTCRNGMLDEQDFSWLQKSAVSSAKLGGSGCSARRTGAPGYCRCARTKAWQRERGVHCVGDRSLDALRQAQALRDCALSVMQGLNRQERVGENEVPVCVGNGIHQSRDEHSTVRQSAGECRGAKLQLQSFQFARHPAVNLGSSQQVAQRRRGSWDPAADES